MLRYLAVVWDSGDAEQCSFAEFVALRMNGTPREWSLTLRSQGLLVWSNGPTRARSGAVAPPGVSGVVLGRLFRRNTQNRDALTQTPLLVDAGSQIEAEGPQYLLDHFWGRYVAMVRSERSGLTWVMRDPSGGLPCYFTSHRGTRVFFSHLEDCLALGLTSFTINWQYVAAFLVDLSLQSAETGLREVSQVQQGECIEVCQSRVTRRMRWNPLDIAATDPIEDLALATQQVRETVSSCVTIWASSYQHVLHRISGGLDSSVMLACLAEAFAPRRFTCLTYYEHSIWGDEREFARLAARHAHCKLIERMQDPARIDFDAVLAFSPSPSPTCYLAHFAPRVIDIEVAAETGADVLFSGAGGDQIFFSSSEELLSVADYLYRHPLGMRLARIAFDTALAGDRAIWNVVPTALFHGLLRRPFDITQDIDRDLQFVNAPIVADARKSGYLHPPWLRAPDQAPQAPPGKLRHIQRMSIADNLHRPYSSDGDPDDVAPLLSQPIVELFLRIPTYLLMAGGRDRMIARRAFTRDLPPQLIARRSKGGPSDFDCQMLRRNERRILDTVLHGVLCKEGYLNRSRIEERFTSQYDSNTAGVMELLQTHFSAEIWLQSLSRIASQTERTC
jgi:asparagine synthase (glutamine-hydrolysing)